MGGPHVATADEPTIVTESLLDAVVVEKDQGEGSLPKSACTDESDRCQAR